MGYTKLLLVIAQVCSVAISASAESFGLDLEAKVDLLSSKIAKLEEDNLQLRKRDSELEMKVSEMQAGHDSSNNLAFDCFLTENWSTDGIITFNGCDGTMILTLMIISSDSELNQCQYSKSQV